VALSLVVANMIGTGIFTSLGLQVSEIKSGFVILVIWALGGIIALTGALCYAEIALILKRSGGEYNYLSEIYHPMMGFISGFISLVVGFAAPMAALGIAIGHYLMPIINPGNPFIAPFIFLSLVTAVNLLGVRPTGLFQNFFTVFKILLLLAFCLIPFFKPEILLNSVSFMPTHYDFKYFFKSEFGVALVYISYAFAGWNASTYIAGQLENPKRSIPYSLILGTGIVTALYLLLNFMFLNVAGFSELAGKIDILNIVAAKIFGQNNVYLISGLVGLALLSSLNSLVIAGPRVLEVAGEDYKAISFLTRKNKLDSPYIAILIQYIIALVLLYSWSFSFILKYIGITLSLSSTLVVIGLFILRIKKITGAFKTWGYPITPVIFISLNILMMLYLGLNTPLVLLPSLGTIMVGGGLYFLVKKFS
jgi:APA family basic amino acid/polyamine antiporter